MVAAARAHGLWPVHFPAWAPERIDNRALPRGFFGDRSSWSCGSADLPYPLPRQSSAAAPIVRSGARGPRRGSFQIEEKQGGRPAAGDIVQGKRVGCASRSFFRRVGMLAGAAVSMLRLFGRMRIEVVACVFVAALLLGSWVVEDFCGTDDDEDAGRRRSCGRDGSAGRWCARSGCEGVA